MRLRWKLSAKETGLRAIFAGHRGSWLHDGEKRYANVSPIRDGILGATTGWYWVAGWDSNVPYRNTCSSPCNSVEEAKAQAMAYVKKHMNAEDAKAS